MAANKPVLDQCSFGSIDYEDIHFTKGIGPKLNDLRNQKPLCDTIIEVEKEHFYVHRCVLAATSPYFHALFTADWTETQEGVVRLKDATTCGFKEVLKFAYTGCATLNDANIKDVLHCAHHYCYPALGELCVKYMITTIAPYNCLHYMNLAEFCAAPNLITKADKMLIDNFSIVSKIAEFMDMSNKALCRYITLPDLPNTSELDVFLAICSWLRHRPERLDFAHVLMMHVQFTLLSQEELQEHVFNCDILRQNESCMKHLLECLANQEQRNMDQSLENRSYAAASTSISPQTVITSYQPKEFFILNKSNHQLTFNVVRPNDSVTDQLNPPSADQIFTSGIFIYGNSLVLLHTYQWGGVFHTSPISYDIATNRWKKLTTAPKGRVGHAAALLNDCVIIVGGQNIRGCVQKSALQYNLTKNTWQAFPSFLYPVDAAAACSFNGAVYVSGGCSLNPVTRFNQMYVCTLGTTTWRQLASMPHAAYGHSLVSVGPKIYAIGGHSACKPNMEILVYYPDRDQWSGVECTGLCRKTLSMTKSVYGDQFAMYAVNSCDDHQQGCCLLCLQDDKGKLKVRCLAHLDFIKAPANPYPLLCCK